MFCLIYTHIHTHTCTGRFGFLISWYTYSPEQTIAGSASSANAQTRTTSHRLQTPLNRNSAINVIHDGYTTPVSRRWYTIVWFRNVITYTNIISRMFGCLFVCVYFYLFIYLFIVLIQLIGVHLLFTTQGTDSGESWLQWYNVNEVSTRHFLGRY